MEVDHRRHLTFPLRLPLSLKESASELAFRDGVSLNHFISLALAEKISRMELAAIVDHGSHGQRPKLTFPTRMNTALRA